jgi:hypothetical protein
MDGVMHGMTSTGKVVPILTGAIAGAVVLA